MRGNFKYFWLGHLYGGLRLERGEAERVIKILLRCDGGCEYCVADLLKLFCKEFPEHKELAESAFRKQFNIELTEFNKKHYHNEA